MMSSANRVVLSLGILVFLAASVSRAASFGMEQAITAEKEAFRAVEAEAWCDALHLFVYAHEAAAALDLIWNAAQAADLAGDRKQALKLYVELLGAYPNSEREEYVRERISVLTKEVANSGLGVSCPVPASVAKLKRSARMHQQNSTTQTQAQNKSGDSHATQAPGKSPSLAAAEQAGSSGSKADAGYLPYATLAVGASSVLLGSVLTAVGAMPYFDFMSAREAILEAERTQASADTWQMVQDGARASWESWGAASVAVGGALLGVGLITAATGGIWAVLGSESEVMEPSP